MARRVCYVCVYLRLRGCRAVGASGVPCWHPSDAGVNNTSGFPGFAAVVYAASFSIYLSIYLARASVYLQTPVGGVPAWRKVSAIRNCSRAAPIAAGYANSLTLQRIDRELTSYARH
eukprot:scaffold73426_cov51-Phaeocystis_antarctica.AAC.1